MRARGEVEHADPDAAGAEIEAEEKCHGILRLLPAFRTVPHGRNITLEKKSFVAP